MYLIYVWLYLSRAIYKEFGRTFRPSSTRFARSLYICNANNVLAKRDLIGHFSFLLGK